MATATKKPPKKRLRQGYLKGMKPPSIKELDKAAEDYVEARDTRMQFGKAEEANRDLVLALMKKHQLTTYEYDGKIVTVKVSDPTEKISVTVKKDAEQKAEVEAK